ncbi:replication initiator protein [Klebsiella pneumoniae]|uniref:Relaxase /helicase n=1 Tax=Enterobacter cloacae TaxID=550 RepID=A0A5P1PIR1_ENTCL|nr:MULTISPECIES: replication initiator protein [Enterobacteriaceae]AVE60640.1 replication initiator protein [Citrobacter koseri]EBI6919702.1 replication initiator protein [Salmonella enterica]EGS2103962.1 replication initiator protein [Escherichia coli]MBX8861530.1 replication initiator protein [Klebsiella variicola]MBX9067321.1 replication initiator protein [Klebsiella aerogenes]
MGSCAAPSAKGDDKFITTDYLQQCLKKPVAGCYGRLTRWKGGGDVVYMALL